MVFFGFASGGIFAAIGKDSHPVVFLLLGFFVCLLPVLFCVIDARSRNLLEMTKPGLIKYEEALPADARVFTRDHKSGKLIRCTTGLRTLFVIQFLCGLGVIDYGVRRLGMLAKECPLWRFPKYDLRAKPSGWPFLVQRL